MSIFTFFFLDEKRNKKSRQFANHHLPRNSFPEWSYHMLAQSLSRFALLRIAKISRTITSV
jgi:hypothetical protein